MSILEISQPIRSSFYKYILCIIRTSKSVMVIDRYNEEIFNEKLIPNIESILQKLEEVKSDENR